MTDSELDDWITRDGEWEVCCTLRDENATLRAQLAKFGRHLGDCPAPINEYSDRTVPNAPRYDCACGLNAAIGRTCVDTLRAECARKDKALRSALTYFEERLEDCDSRGTRQTLEGQRDLLLRALSPANNVIKAGPRPTPGEAENRQAEAELKARIAILETVLHRAKALLLEHGRCINEYPSGAWYCQHCHAETGESTHEQNCEYLRLMKLLEHTLLPGMHRGAICTECGGPHDVDSGYRCPPKTEEKKV